MVMSGYPFTSHLGMVSEHPERHAELQRAFGLAGSVPARAGWAGAQARGGRWGAVGRRWRSSWQLSLSVLSVLLLLTSCAGSPTPASGPDSTALPTPAPATDSTDLPTPAPATSSPPGDDASHRPTASSPPIGSTSPPTASPEECTRCSGDPVRTGMFDAGVIPEASGLGASARNPGVLWVLDDGPRTTGVWTVRKDGEILGLVEVEGLRGTDTEGLAVAPCEAGGERSCVYVGDIGDNLRAGRAISVHRFPEPNLSQGVPADPVPAERAELRYPDASFDAETLLVADGVPYLVTKARFNRDTQETGATHLFGADAFADGELRDLGVVPVPEASFPLLSTVAGTVVTGGDYSPQRRGQGSPPAVLLRTYDHVLEYIAPGPGSSLQNLSAWEFREVPGPGLLQSEAIAYESSTAGRDAAGCGWYTVSEGIGDIWFVPCAQ